jgi:hypothetical protein
VTVWPPVPAPEGAPVMYGGYPGVHRTSLLTETLSLGSSSLGKDKFTRSIFDLRLL